MGMVTPHSERMSFDLFCEETIVAAAARKDGIAQLDLRQISQRNLHQETSAAMCSNSRKRCLIQYMQMSEKKHFGRIQQFDCRG